MISVVPRHAGPRLLHRGQRPRPPVPGDPQLRAALRPVPPWSRSVLPEATRCPTRPPVGDPVLPVQRGELRHQRLGLPGVHLPQQRHRPAARPVSDRGQRSLPKASSRREASRQGTFGQRTSTSRPREESHLHCPALSRPARADGATTPARGRWDKSCQSHVLIYSGDLGESLTCCFAPPTGLEPVTLRYATDIFHRVSSLRIATADQHRYAFSPFVVGRCSSLFPGTFLGLGGTIGQ